MARPPNQVRRMCNYCGHDYPQPIWLVGIPRCPSCWHGESCIYHDGQGNVLEDYVSEDEFQRKRILEDYPRHDDNGCKLATEYMRNNGLGDQSRCLECPFESMCVEDIDAIVKKSQLVYLARKDIIIKVFELKDRGERIVDISNELNVPTPTICGWLRRRKKIEPILCLTIETAGVK